VKVGDLVRLKSPFEPVTCLIVRSINESTDDFFEVLSAKSCKTYNMPKNCLELINESR